MPDNLWEQLENEIEEAQHDTKAQQEPIEPTVEEKRNGWTKEALTKYLAERNAGQSLSVDVNSLHRRVARRPNEQNHSYRPHRWRD